MLVSSSSTIVPRYSFFLFLKCLLASRLTLFRLHKLSERRLTADWLAPRESDCSRLRSKVSSDWLPSYIKATRPVLEIFKMAWYFSDSPRTVNWIHFSLQCLLKFHCLYHGKGKNCILLYRHTHCLHTLVNVLDLNNWHGSLQQSIDQAWSLSVSLQQKVSCKRSLLRTIEPDVLKRAAGEGWRSVGPIV
jgi:hypothetical protein